jgi:ABC-type Fe3+/spermidine/putrescine transport system ATPase subunit
MAILQLDHLTKNYGDFTAVNDLSLTVADGEMVALLGESGCGKTTTLRMIAGFTEVNAGTVTIDGTVMNSIPAYKRNIGIFFQNYALFPHLTAYDNISFGLKLKHLSKKAIKEKAEHIIQIVKLEGLENRYPRELSGGQQQRVALARALIMEPSVLLLDEPLSNLDAKLRIEMQVEIKRIQRLLGITTILVTHDQEEAISLADRVVLMDKGSIVQVGRPQEVFENPASLFIADFMGFVNFIEATVGKQTEGETTLHCSNNQTLSLPLMKSSLTQGDHITLAIRPEQIRLVAPEGQQLLSGQIGNATYKGNITRLEIREVFDKPLYAHLSDYVGFSGETIGVYLPPEKIRIFKTT